MSASATPPLAGLRVLDLTRLLPGGYCTALLADLGADVLKVERPGVGDELRITPPYLATGESALHRLLGRGKRSITLDLKQVEGVDILRQLAGQSDVLVESFRPGVLERLGVGRSTLQAVAPSLVFASITAFGRLGDLAARPGHDLNAQAHSGALSLAPGPAAGPATPYLQAADMAAGLQAALGILAALLARGTAGSGRCVDVSMTDAVSSLLVVASAAVLATGQATPVDTLTGALACYTTYACADGRWLAVGALEPGFFAELCGLLDRPELAALQFEQDRQDELRAALSATFRTRSQSDWTGLLAGADTCVTAVRTLAEAMADPQSPSAPAPAAAPALGAHTMQVLTHLGYSAEACAVFAAGGVV